MGGLWLRLTPRCEIIPQITPTLPSPVKGEDFLYFISTGLLSPPRGEVRVGGRLRVGRRAEPVERYLSVHPYFPSGASISRGVQIVPQKKYLRASAGVRKLVTICHGFRNFFFNPLRREERHGEGKYNLYPSRVLILRPI